MNKKKFFGLVILGMSMLRCNNVESGTVQRPTPGTVVAAISEPIVDEPLNEFTSSIEVMVDSTADGVYDVVVMYGPNSAVGKFTMPKGIEHVVPSVRKGKVNYSYIVGFKLPDDTTFYEYYEVVSSKSATKMQYLNSYSFK